MSFTIKFQRSNSPKNQISKTISDVITLEGVLRSECSILNPSILVETSNEDIITCNYMTIAKFSRQYFITSIESTRNNLWLITGHVDVLSTYADKIRQNTAIVLRQQNNWDLYLDDGAFKADQNPILVMKQFPNALDTFQYVLACSG